MVDETVRDDSTYVNNKISVRLESKYIIEKKLGQINRRAIKHGLKPMTCNWGDSYVRSFVNEAGLKYGIDYVDAYVTGQVPCFNGWRLLGAIDSVDGHNIIRSVPGKSIPVEYREANRCDVCKIDRRRVTLYVIQHESEETKITGSNCLSVMLPGCDPEALILMLDAWTALDAFQGGDEDGYGGGSGGITKRPLEAVLTATAAVCSIIPWVSRKTASESNLQSTSDIVYTLLWGTGRQVKEIQERLDKAEFKYESVKDEVAAAIEWVSTVDTATDYFYNIKTLADIGWVGDKHLGLACSILQTYRREMMQKALKDASPSQYVGSLKERLKKIPVTFISCNVFDSFYGTKGVLKFQDEKGNLFVSFTDPIKNAPGTKFKLTGTVKKHEEFRGIPQTTLSRIALEEIK